MAGRLLRRTELHPLDAAPDRDRCAVHHFEPAVDVCRDCRRPHCHECVVYALGPGKPPYCVACALRAAGIRSR